MNKMIRDYAEQKLAEIMPRLDTHKYAEHYDNVSKTTRITDDLTLRLLAAQFASGVLSNDYYILDTLVSVNNFNGEEVING